jgi:hypothetical protein
MKRKEKKTDAQDSDYFGWQIFSIFPQNKSQAITTWSNELFGKFPKKYRHILREESYELHCKDFWMIWADF